MVVTTNGCIKNHASRSAFLYNVNNKRLGLPVVLTQVAQDVYCLLYMKKPFCWRAYFTGTSWATCVGTSWATCVKTTGSPRRLLFTLYKKALLLACFLIQPLVVTTIVFLHYNVNNINFFSSE